MWMVFADLAVADQTDNAISVLSQRRQWAFHGRIPELPVGTAPASIATADFNGDGLPDAATANNGSDQAP